MIVTERDPWMTMGRDLSFRVETFNISHERKISDFVA